MYMHENFTEAYETRLHDGKDVMIEDIEFGEIKVWLDMSSKKIFINNILNRSTILYHCYVRWL